jgi:histidine ammonia-lyase
MGMTGALKLRQIVENVERVVAIELMCAAQGLECRLPLKPGIEVGSAYEAVRRVVTPLEQDRVLSGDMERLAAAVRGGSFASF